jgi:hypothetical protein
LLPTWPAATGPAAWLMTAAAAAALRPADRFPHY